MTKNHKFFSKKLFLLLAALCALAVFFIFRFLLPTDSQKFQKLSQELFYHELSTNSLNLHYTLAYPENYGFDPVPVLPSSFSEEDLSPQILEWKSKLAQIDIENLSSQDQYAYSLFSSFLDTALEGAPFSYYDEPLSPSSGMISGIPILLADYTFRCAKDVEDYLELLDQTDTYFDGLIAYEYEKSASGRFMSDAAAEKVIEQCYSIMDTNTIAAGEHFLQKTFEERLAELEQILPLSETQKQNWISQNNRLLLTVMAPSYERVADALFLLKGTGKNTMGLYYYPEGKSYYEYLLHSVTGSSRSIPEIKRMLEEDFQKNWNSMRTLLAEQPDILAVSQEDVSFSFPSENSKTEDLVLLSQSMLEDLKQKMSRDFPQMPQSAKVPIRYTVKKVSPSMENFSSPAYYLTPPIDNMQQNTIYINCKNISDDLSLYTTLAHEGYPGHLYQTVYTQQFLNESNASYIRSLLHYGGFVEGWALYVENLSYQYAAALTDQPLEASYIEACRLNRNLLLCLYSYMDIAIHYEGATPNQIRSFLEHLGIFQGTAVDAVYEYLVEEPGNYLKYYLGYLEFLSLKEQAKALWGSQYTDYQFHKFLLETGAGDFSSLQTQLSLSSY